MEIIFDKINIILIITALFNLTLAAIIYQYSPGKKHARVYSLHILAIIAWILGMIFYRSSSPANAVLFAILLYLAPTFIASLFFYFTCIFPFPDGRWFKAKIAVVFSLNLFLAIIVAIPGLIISDVKVMIGEENRLYFGSWYIVYFLYTILIFFAGYIQLFLKYLKSEKKARAQTLYILIGHLLSSNLAFATNLIMPWIGVFYLNWLGQVFTVIMLALTTYAIIAHHLMDIKLVIRDSGILIFSLCLLVAFIFGTNIFLGDFFPGLGAWSHIIVAVLAALIFPLLQGAFARLASKYFFYSLYDTRKVVSEISKKLVTTLEQREIYDFVYKTFSRIFLVKNFCVLKKERGDYTVSYSRGFKISSGQTVKIDKELEGEHISQREILDTDDLKAHRLFSGEGQKRFEKMERNVELLVPLSTKNGLVGLLLFGPKESSDMYSDGDLKLLYIVGSQIASAMENVELYAEISELNKELEKKVARQTLEIKRKAEELEEKNESLNKLLQVKSEFLRIVNHQLNTPVSIIKNSIYMVRNGSFSSEKGLAYIEEGLKRMEEIVNDFWKAFSFEGEGIKISLAETDIARIVDDIVAAAREQAVVREKGLSIIVEKGFKIPKVKSDPKEIAQAFGNLLDNSISYTDSGSVSIIFKRVGRGFLKISIRDTGCGIDKADREKLFQKFSRGARAISHRPGGSGLGLYIAKKIVEAGGGQLKLEKTEVGKGTEFSLTLPVWK